MVVACISPSDLRPETDDVSGTVRADPRRSDLTAADAAALEHALRIAEAWDGWVLVVAVGPPEIEPILRDTAALGAEVIRIDPALHSEQVSSSGPAPVSPIELVGRPGAIAAALAGAIRSRGAPVIVLCGDRSAGVGAGAVPALLAHEMGLDQALGLVSVQLSEDGTLVGERRLDGGWRERLAVRGPAVLSVEGAGVRLRRASLEAALSEPASVPTERAAAHFAEDSDLRVGTPRPYRPRTRPVGPPTGNPHERLLALTGALSAREPARVVGPVDAATAADELLVYLRRSGYID
jgi:electron transfer flavoprotein beta subunit